MQQEGFKSLAKEPGMIDTIKQIVSRSDDEIVILKLKMFESYMTKELALKKSDETSPEQFRFKMSEIVEMSISQSDESSFEL